MSLPLLMRILLFILVPLPIMVAVEVTDRYRRSRR
jgi:hypothetical protein